MVAPYGLSHPGRADHVVRGPSHPRLHFTDSMVKSLEAIRRNGGWKWAPYCHGGAHGPARAGCVGAASGHIIDSSMQMRDEERLISPGSGRRSSQNLKSNPRLESHQLISFFPLYKMSSSLGLVWGWGGGGGGGGGKKGELLFTGDPGCSISALDYAKALCKLGNFFSMVTSLCVQVGVSSPLRFRHEFLLSWTP